MPTSQGSIQDPGFINLDGSVSPLTIGGMVKFQTLKLLCKVPYIKKFNIMPIGHVIRRDY